MRPIKSKPGNPINSAADKLDAINEKIVRMEGERDKVIQEIRESAHEAVVVFVDMVGSTDRKLAHQKEPEIWIFAIRQFYEVASAYVQRLGGRLVKYIGDEVMAVFDEKTQINDAASFIARIAEIQQALSDMTREPTNLKVAIDVGPVYAISVPGQSELDILGTPVDRCARIAKHAKVGVVLASIDFVKRCENTAYRWELVGEPQLKSIGALKVYQLGKKTVDIVSLVEIPEYELSKLNEDLTDRQSQVEALGIELRQCKNMNQALQNEIEQLGHEPPEDECVTEAPVQSEDELLWEQIEGDIRDLRKVVETAGVAYAEYARFLFLHMKGEVNVPIQFERDFDACIDKNLVETEMGGWVLSQSHPRNKRAIHLMDRIEKALSRYEEEFRDHDDYDELFTYSLCDPDFWNAHVGFSVM